MLADGGTLRARRDAPVVLVAARTARGHSSPVRNWARPWPNDQSSSPLLTSDTTTSVGSIPHRARSRSQSRR